MLVKFADPLHLRAAFDNLNVFLSNVELNGVMISLLHPWGMIGQEHKKKDPHIDAQVSMQVKTEEPLKNELSFFKRGIPQDVLALFGTWGPIELR